MDWAFLFRNLVAWDCLHLPVGVEEAPHPQPRADRKGSSCEGNPRSVGACRDIAHKSRSVDKVPVVVGVVAVVVVVVAEDVGDIARLAD